MGRPPLTVITATFNQPAALACALSSAQAQSFADFEYLVIGDGCTDETEEMVRDTGDPRIRWTNLTENSGNQSDVNRIALEMAAGERVAYLNHDDLWYPEHLNELMTCMDDGGFELASTLALAISPEPHLHRQVVGLPTLGAQDDNIRVSSMTSTVMHTHDLASRAGGWKRWRESSTVPTLDFFARARAAANRHAVLPRITCLKFHSADRLDSYLRNDGSEQRSWLEQMRSDPDLRHREMATAWALQTMRSRVPKLRQPDRPPNPPPGWQIEQYRLLRGLRPMLDGVAPRESQVAPKTDGPLESSGARRWIPITSSQSR